MKTSGNGIVEIFSHEGIVPFPYFDSVGVATFGGGHTAAAGPPDPRKMAFGVERPLTEVVEVFRRDLTKFEKRVTKAVKVPVMQTEFDALVSFDFNTGGIDRAQLTKSLNERLPREVVADQFMRWSKPPEIIPRRKKERALFLTGKYSSGGYANVYPADANGRVLYKKGRRVNVATLVPGIIAANEADEAATANRNAGIATGGTGAATGTTQLPSPAELPTDGGMLRMFLIGFAVTLVIAGVVFAIRAIRKRAAAKRLNDSTARALEVEIAVAEAIEGEPHK